MNEAHVKALEREIALARDLMRSGKHDEAFVHLERAHVLGQEQVRPHVLAHWLMLKVAVRRHDPVAALGKLLASSLERWGQLSALFRPGIRVVATSACSSACPSTRSS